MKDWKKIANDYYLEGRNNASIFEKYDLARTKKHFSQERIYELLPEYSLDATCPYCETNMAARFVSKSAALDHNESGKFNHQSNVYKLFEEKSTQSNKLGYRRPSYGKAYRTIEGYRVSAPECSNCSHQQSPYCDCSNCHETKIINSIRAAEDFYSRLESIEKFTIDDLSCADTLVFLEHLVNDSETPSANLISHSFQTENGFNKSLALFVLDAFEIDRSHLPAGIKMTSVNSYVSMLERIHFKPKQKNAKSRCIRDLKIKAMHMFKDEVLKIELIEVWKNLALDECLKILEHYCGVHGLYYRPGEKTTNAIKKSLRIYGLALTARYIYNSVCYSKRKANEAGYSNLRAFNLVYGNLTFWIDDPRARTYTAQPFTRKDGVFSEPTAVSIFSEFFLEPHGIDYLNSAIAYTKVE